jgi:hypothetical protein
MTGACRYTNLDLSKVGICFAALDFRPVTFGERRAEGWFRMVLKECFRLLAPRQIAVAVVTPLMRRCVRQQLAPEWVRSR